MPGHCFPPMKNFLIVGASSGIGETLASQLKEAGYQVFGTYCKHGEKRVPGVAYHHVDVLSDGWNVDFLPEQLHGLAYCPGRIILNPFARIAPGDFEEDYQLQVLGAIKVIQSTLPRLKNSGAGAVVLFSTVAVQTGFPFHSMVSASKGAIEGLTRALAAELAPAIRVNRIAPSLTDTPLAAPLLNSVDKRETNAQRHPLKRIGTPSDVAHAAEFLLTGKSGWVTGQVFHVDGGISTIK